MTAQLKGRQPCQKAFAFIFKRGLLLLGKKMLPGKDFFFLFKDEPFVEVFPQKVKKKKNMSTFKTKERMKK